MTFVENGGGTSFFFLSDDLATGGGSAVDETVDAMHRSFERRRTIDLRSETTSERGIFKSQMTTIGCGLLTLTLVGLLALLLFGSAIDSRKRIEADAQREGFVIHRNEFVHQEATLTPGGERHVGQIAQRMSRVSTPILIERSEQSSNRGLDRRRRQTVVLAFEGLNHRDSHERTILSTIHGQGVTTVMKIARLAWLAPLVLFLLLQLLVFVAKPASSMTESESS